MTPEDRAASATHRLDDADYLHPELTERAWYAAHAIITAAIHAAVVEEREACAKLAAQDSMLDWIGGSTGNAAGTRARIVAAIRARSMPSNVGRATGDAGALGVTPAKRDDSGATNVRRPGA